MKFYTYYRSQASFRVRIALNLKGITREDSFLHLEKGDQFAAAYRAINPQMVVADLDRRRHQAVSVVAHPRISRREISGAAAITGRCAGASLGTRDRLDQRGRLAPADRAARSPLSDKGTEGQR